MGVAISVPHCLFCLEQGARSDCSCSVCGLRLLHCTSGMLMCVCVEGEGVICTAGMLMCLCVEGEGGAHFYSMLFECVNVSVYNTIC